MIEKFNNVSVKCKANVYFDGKVVSHTVLFPDGSRKTFGLILSPGNTSSTPTCRKKWKSRPAFAA